MEWDDDEQDWIISPSLSPTHPNSDWEDAYSWCMTYDTLPHVCFQVIGVGDIWTTNIKLDGSGSPSDPDAKITITAIDTNSSSVMTVYKLEWTYDYDEYVDVFNLTVTPITIYNGGVS